MVELVGVRLIAPQVRRLRFGSPIFEWMPVAPVHEASSACIEGDEAAARATVARNDRFDVPEDHFYQELLHVTLADPTRFPTRNCPACLHTALASHGSSPAMVERPGRGASGLSSVCRKGFIMPLAARISRGQMHPLIAGIVSLTVMVQTI